MVMFMNGTDQGWNAVLLPCTPRPSWAGPKAIGLLTALFGAGGLAGALLYGAVGHRFSRRAVFTVCVILCGAPRFLVAGGDRDGAAAGGDHAAGRDRGRGAEPDPDDGDLRARPGRAAQPGRGGADRRGASSRCRWAGSPPGCWWRGSGSSAALLVMGGVYFLATLSPLVFPSWRTMEGPAADGEAGQERPRRTGREPVGPRAGQQLGTLPPCSSASQRVHRAVQGGDGDQPQPLGQFGLGVGALGLRDEEDGRPVAPGGLRLQRDPADRADLAVRADRARTGDGAAAGEVAAAAVAVELVDDAEGEEQPGAGPADVGEVAG